MWIEKRDYGHNVSPLKHGAGLGVRSALGVIRSGVVTQGTLDACFDAIKL